MGLVRYYLAFSVVVAHFNEIFQTDFFFPTSSYHAVGGFFALSGFLIYRSFERDQSTKSFILRRVKRICPPYFFIILLAAFGLVAVSSLSAQEYFSSPGWAKYLISNLLFLNFVHPDLPGVFEDLQIHAVNGSLWTLKVEWALYLSVPIIFLVISRFKRKWDYRTASLVIFVIIYLFSCAYRFFLFRQYELTGNEIYSILSRQFLGQFMYFYSGVAIYFLYNAFMRCRFLLMAVSLVGVLFIPEGHWLEFLVAPVFISILTIGCSMFKGAAKIFNRNNISYDIYLFHFPILQVFCQYKDSMSEIPSLLILVLAGIAILLLSYFSWFVIERRFLSS